MRTTATAVGGAGYDGSIGVGTVDYSQQNAPQLTVTDGACTGNTALTSVTGGFTAEMVGNCLSIHTSLPSYDGHYQIVAWVSTNQVTLDRNGPNDTSLTVRVGGAITVAANGFLFGSVVAAGNKIWVKAGTYTLVSNTPTIAVGSVTQPVTVEGYNTTRGDITTNPALTRPVFQWSANAINCFRMNGTGVIVRGMEFDNRTQVAGQAAVQFASSAANCVMENCIVRGPSSGAENINVSGTRNTVRKNYVVCGAADNDGIWLTGTGDHACVENHITSLGSPNNFTGIVADVGYGTIRNNIIEDVTFGINSLAASLSAWDIQNNALHRCVHGVYIANAAQGIATLKNVRANIFSRLTNGIRYNPSDISLNTGVIQWAAANIDCNFFYTVTNQFSQLPAGTNSTTLTADPFTDEAAGDFSLNSLEGGGAAVRDGVCSSTLPDGINAVRFTAGPTGEPETASDAASLTASMRSLWRELTGEVHATPVPDARVDVYLQFGLEELNRLLKYHITTDGGGVTLVSGTQSYDVTQDTVAILRVSHNGVPLTKTSIEDEERRDENWQQQNAGFPQRWAHEAGKLYLFPKPSDAAVAATSALVVRRANKPASITTAGPVQLPTDLHRPAVVYGVYMWALTPYNEWGRDVAQGLKEAFETSVQVGGVDFAQRGIAR